MRFKLNGNFITGPVDITDISVDGDGINDPLICQSQRTTSQLPSPSSMGNWYLHHESESTAPSNRLGESERGWIRTRTTTGGYRQVKLKRQSVTGAREGRFTCKINNDTNPRRSLYVLYPSELCHSVLLYME